MDFNFYATPSPIVSPSAYVWATPAPSGKAEIEKKRRRKGKEASTEEQQNQSPTRSGSSSSNEAMDLEMYAQVEQIERAYNSTTQEHNGTTINLGQRSESSSSQSRSGFFNPGHFPPPSFPGVSKEEINPQAKAFLDAFFKSMLKIWTESSSLSIDQIFFQTFKSLNDSPILHNLLCEINQLRKWVDYYFQAYIEKYNPFSNKLNKKTRIERYEQLFKNRIYFFKTCLIVRQRLLAKSLAIGKHKIIEELLHSLIKSEEEFTTEYLVDFVLEDDDLNSQQTIFKSSVEVLGEKEFKRKVQELTFIAANEGWVHVLEWCLDHGANVNSINKKGETILHVAAKRGDKTVAELALSKGANIEARDNEKRTALHYAVSKGKVAMIRSLIEKGANFRAEAKFSDNILHIVMVETKEKFRNEILEFLMDLPGIEELVNLRDTSNDTFIGFIETVEKEEREVDNEIKTIDPELIEKIKKFADILPPLEKVESDSDTEEMEDENEEEDMVFMKENSEEEEEDEEVMFMRESSEEEGEPFSKRRNIDQQE